MNDNQNIFNLGRNKGYSFLYSAITIVLAVFLVAGIVYAAWTEPSTIPPDPNVDAPINTGSTPQTKTGALTTGGFTSSGEKIIHNLSIYDDIWGQWTTIGTPKSLTGLNADYYGLLTAWDSDYAFFGLKHYGDDRKDVIIGLEQDGDNFRFQVAGSDKVTIDSAGKIQATGDICTNQGGGVCLSASSAGGENLEETLAIGNSAGSNDINMNGMSLENAEKIDFSDSIGSVPTEDGTLFRYDGQAAMAFDDWFQMYDSDNGALRIEFNIDDASVLAKLYYDRDDTGYYVDPASTSKLKCIDLDGTTKCAWPSGADGYLPDNPATSNVDMDGKRIENLASADSDDDAQKWGDIKSWAQQDIDENCEAGEYAYGVSDAGALQCRAAPEGDGYLPNNPATSNVDMNGYDIVGIDRLVADSSDYVEVKSSSASYGLIVRDYDSSNWIDIDANNMEIRNNTGNFSINTAADLYLNPAGGQTYATDFRAAIFYDRDSPGYYVNPNSTSRQYRINTNILDFSHSADARTAADGVLFRYGSQAAMAFDDWFRMYDSDNGALRIEFNIDDASVRANRYYDRNDTNYYADPASTSYFNVIYGKSFLYWSDRTLKIDIKPISNSLDKILKLQGVSFNWKDTGELSIGLISQDVEKIFPEIISTDEQGLKSIEYAKLIAPLIEAIKEQQKEIEELQVEIEKLKK